MYQNVWSSNNYIYHTTLSGIDVYNNDTSILIDHIPITDVTSVWADSTYIYIGTSNSGIYRATVSGVAIPYKIWPDITSDLIVYLHGAGEFLCATTGSGVDQYNTVSGTRIYTSISGTAKCFQTSSGPFYYSIGPELNAVYGSSNWTDPDYIYDDLLFVTAINDIHITEGTSSYNNHNTIFLATDVGAHVIEERRGDESNSVVKRYYIT